MKVIEGDECQDKYGRGYIVFTGVKNLYEVYDWLYQHYWGYKFGIVFDCTKDCPEPDKKNLCLFP